MNTIYKVVGSLALAVSCSGFAGFVQADGCTNATILGEYGSQDSRDRNTEVSTLSHDAVIVTGWEEDYPIEVPYTKDF